MGTRLEAETFMKIFLPFQVKDIGGTSTFAKKFQTGMRAHGHEVFFEYRDDYDILFLIVQAPFKYLLEAKKRNIPIIQRLDGCYYFTVSGWKYPLYNLKAAIIRRFFATFTIYQSEYSKYCGEKLLGKKSSSHSEIIYNGVDTDIFSPQGETIDLRDTSDQKIFFTASEFRRRDQIIPILEAIKQYEKKYDSNFKLVIAGSFSRELEEFTEHLSKYPKVQYLGKIPNNDLPKYERSADVFLFTHLNPPCPNNVIEAMACGLPICGVADGAMTEITEQNGNALLLEVIGDAFWKKRDYNPQKFSENINHILQERILFSKKSRALAVNRYSLENMITRYEQAFSSLLKKI